MRVREIIGVGEKHHSKESQASIERQVCVLVVLIIYVVGTLCSIYLFDYLDIYLYPWVAVVIHYTQLKTNPIK